MDGRLPPDRCPLPRLCQARHSLVPTSCSLSSRPFKNRNFGADMSLANMKPAYISDGSLPRVTHYHRTAGQDSNREDMLTAPVTRTLRRSSKDCSQDRTETRERTSGSRGSGGACAAGINKLSSLEGDVRAPPLRPSATDQRCRHSAAWRRPTSRSRRFDPRRIDGASHNARRRKPDYKTDVATLQRGRIGRAGAPAKI